MSVLESLKKKLEKRGSKPKRPLPQRPRLIEVFLSRERPLCLAIRGAVGLIDHKLELDYMKNQPKPKPKAEIDYAV